MRADRLLSLLMLLQARGRMTAEALADELETSVRTIYRDVEALSMAGIPVYAERGRSGGIALLERFQTNLTGLTENEVRALFMLSIPGPLADLGVREELRAAMYKLSAALPASRRQDEAFVRQRVHLDASWWFHASEPVPHLATVQQAVWQDRGLCLTHAPSNPAREAVERRVEPYGLVAKAGVWYLVARRNDQFRAYRVSRLLDAQLMPETFARDVEFDLADFWQAWCREFEESRADYPVRVRVAPEIVPLLPSQYGDPVRAQIAQAAPDAEGWITITLNFEYLEMARARLLGYGRAVEVLEPEALRLSLIDYAAQIVAFYRER
jgi:predicted DNA-binding transcriptional regulator YafY